MMCAVNGALQQVAVISWLMPPCNVAYPTVLTNLADTDVRQWLQSVAGVP